MQFSKLRNLELSLYNCSTYDVLQTSNLLFNGILQDQEAELYFPQIDRILQMPNNIREFNCYLCYDMEEQQQSMHNDCQSIELLMNRMVDVLFENQEQKCQTHQFHCKGEESIEYEALVI